MLYFESSQSSLISSIYNLFQNKCVFIILFYLINYILSLYYIFYDIIYFKVMFVMKNLLNITNCVWVRLSLVFYGDQSSNKKF